MKITLLAQVMDDPQRIKQRKGLIRRSRVRFRWRHGGIRRGLDFSHATA
jgi:hypothetical protein